MICNIKKCFECKRELFLTFKNQYSCANKHASFYYDGIILKYFISHNQLSDFILVKEVENKINISYINYVIEVNKCYSTEHIVANGLNASIVIDDLLIERIMSNIIFI